MLNEKIVKEATALKTAGATLAKIRGFLAYSDVSSKDAEKWLKEQGWVGSNSKWTQANTLQYCEAGVSEHDLLQKLIDCRAKNELRWFNDRNKIRGVICSVYAKLGAPIEQQAATSEQQAIRKAIVAGTYKEPASGPAGGLGGGASEQECGIAAAWKKLSAAKAEHAAGKRFSKREARAFHPDKVHCHGDADLERAYCDFYQNIT